MNSSQGKNDIMYRVLTHLEEAEKFVNNDKYRIFGIFLVGSQNYHLDTEASDVDTRVVVFPSMEDIATNKAPTNVEHHMPNGEHVTIVDFRLWMKQIKKQNIHELEVFFTDYYRIMAPYVDIWQQMYEMREDIARYDAMRAMHSAVGIAFRYHGYIHNVHPNNEKSIDKFGYDPKSLSNLYRICDYLKKYKEGLPMKECLVPNDIEWLKMAKKGEIFTADSAKVSSDLLKSQLDKMKRYLACVNIDRNEEVDNKFDEWSVMAFNQYLRMIVY